MSDEITENRSVGSSVNESSVEGADSREKRHICSCRFPKLIIDKSYGDGDNTVIFYSIPIDVIDDMGMVIPLMEEVEQLDLKGVVGRYMKVTWEEPHIDTKMYDVLGHLVVAGCSEDAQQCDVKSIYVVYHPILEWKENHIIDYK
jgi:hypothetical protein